MEKLQLPPLPKNFNYKRDTISKDINDEEISKSFKTFFDNSRRNKQKNFGDNNEEENRKLPNIWDLRTQIDIPLQILYQGELGSCTSCQVSKALVYCRLKGLKEDDNNYEGSPQQNNKDEEKYGSYFQPSVLFIYYYGRKVWNMNLNEDTGLCLRGAIEAVKQYGVPPEKFWPYQTDDFAQEPDERARNHALLNYSNKIKFAIVPQTLEAIKAVLRFGHPVLLGVLMYDSFISQQTLTTGRIELPDTQKESIIGGHSMGIYGWDDNTQLFLMMNTWSDQYGDKGWFYIPYEYILNKDLCFDIWTITHFY